MPQPTGVQTTASGLKYEVLKMGAGAKPTLADNVTVHYRGELTNGTVFDSSYDRGQPATFPLSRVVQGWQEGVQLMPVGSTYRFEIPPNLGYGASGAGNTIPPNATLIFQVELIAIN
jgi:FKBP-type peptidyl-prolyl cis-trans isomerase